MSLPKEPRQKMINMMYLVLTALLALNVSAEILNAFKTVNNSIIQSNGVVTEKNDLTYKSFSKKLDDPATAALARLDLGSVRLPLPADAQVQVEMDPAGPLRAVHVLTPNGRFTVSAYAAPKSGDLWPEVSRELSDQLHGDGARVRREYGEWGAELVAFVNKRKVAKEKVKL